MAGNRSVQKICLICKQDCAARPRVRDNQGQYYCKACIAKRKQERTAGAIPIDTAELPPMKTCSVCVRPMAPGTVVCMNCGHDTRKGIQTSTLVQKTRQRSGKYRLTCSHCGYDLTGAAGLTCPKCGTHVDIASPDRLNEKIRRSTIRDAYRKPILMILIGLGSIVLFHAVTNQSDELLEYFIGYAVSVPFGIIAFFVCCSM